MIVVFLIRRAKRLLKRQPPKSAENIIKLRFVALLY
jgi:hypothetical protein